mmetsp:Transcript_43737/g.31886  ORF Transcript_43737/g.31886 Transcript_43737/m.31886 type:complete len:86 (-) Transcript_43737:111-368(-)
MFHLKSMIDMQDQEEFLFNHEAQKLYKEDFPKFVLNCKMSAEKSYDDRLKNNQANTLLKFSDHIPLHDKILEQIKQHSKDEANLY